MGRKPIDFYNLPIVNKTRKEHICFRCGEIIKIGSSTRWKCDFAGKRKYAHFTILECTITQEDES